MPTYDYACDGCGHEFEEFQFLSAEPLKKCPGCKKNKLHRLIGGGSGVLFKGSGFYETDYRSESYKKDAKGSDGGSSEKGAEAKKSETKGETAKKADKVKKAKKSEG